MDDSPEVTKECTHFYYEILNTYCKEYPILVIAKSYMSPLSMLEFIEEELGDMSGVVLFDLFIFLAYESNRYIAGNIIEGKFDRESFHNVLKIPLRITVVSKCYFGIHINYLSRSVIPNLLKHWDENYDSAFYCGLDQDELDELNEFE